MCFFLNKIVYMLVTELYKYQYARGNSSSNNNNNNNNNKIFYILLLELPRLL